MCEQAYDASHCKVEAQGEKTGVHAEQRIPVCEHQECDGTHPDHQPGEYSRHCDAFRIKTKHNAREELRYAGISHQQKRDQSGGAVDREVQRNSSDQQDHDLRQPGYFLIGHSRGENRPPEILRKQSRRREH